MRTLLSIILLGALALSGCASRKHASPPPARAEAPPPKASTTNETLIVTPTNVLVGKVALINTTARFVVLNFPLGKMAGVEQRLNLYRRGLKVGEVKVTGPQREDNIIADLVAGEAEVGDEARSQ
jgi:hypothetical protein